MLTGISAAREHQPCGMLSGEYSPDSQMATLVITVRSVPTVPWRIFAPFIRTAAVERWITAVG
jgi:hypothetical protein